jgi:predicted aspartyl protease
MNGVKSLILVLALFWPACGALAADASQCSRSTLKIDSSPDGRIRIPVTIEGRKLSFLLDTGGVSTTIKWEVAKEMHLPVRQSEHRLGGAGGSLLNFYVTAQNFAVGDVSVKNRPIFIEPRALPDADGTLAPDVLRDYGVEIDATAGNLSLISPDYCTKDATAVIAMDVTKDGHVRFLVKLNGQAIVAILDTGSTTSLIGARIAGLLGVRPNSPGLAFMRNIGQYQIYSYTFQSLDFGGVSMKSPRIAIASNGFSPDTDNGLVLGMDALRLMHFTIAYGEGRLFISSAPAN